MDAIQGGARILTTTDNVPADGARSAAAKKTVAPFSTALAQANMEAAVPTLLPIARNERFFSQDGVFPIPPRDETPSALKERFHERALGLRAYRQTLLASNIANVDTPGYQAVDIDIEDAIRNEHSSASKVEVKYRVPAQGSIDGNTVEMDVERAKFAKNALMYEYQVDRVKGFYKMIDDLLKSTPY